MEEYPKIPVCDTLHCQLGSDSPIPEDGSGMFIRNIDIGL